MPRLLLIEDDAPVRKMLALALSRDGHTVLEAENGRHCAKQLRAEPVDLVITDLVMPDQEGLETISLIRRTWPQLPIIAISGNPNGAEYLALAARLGAQRTFAKPFRTDELLRAIDELLGRDPGRAPTA